MLWLDTTLSNSFWNLIANATVLPDVIFQRRLGQQITDFMGVSVQIFLKWLSYCENGNLMKEMIWWFEWEWPLRTHRFEYMLPNRLNSLKHLVFLVGWSVSLEVKFKASKVHTILSSSSAPLPLDCSLNVALSYYSRTIPASCCHCDSMGSTNVWAHSPPWSNYFFYKLSCHAASSGQ